MLAGTEICIDYGDGTTFDTLDDQTNESRDPSEEKESNPQARRWAMIRKEMMKDPLSER